MPAALLACLLCTGCAARIDEIAREPNLSPMGAGLETRAADSLHAMKAQGRPAGLAGASLYRDHRASSVGDIITVRIEVNDRASFDNKSNRSRKSSADYHLNGDYKADAAGSSISGSAGLGSDTASAGKGQIDRSERVDFMIAAVVVDVLGNGNLMIAGTQEFRVNHELRVLKLEGIVRPSDISRDNSISSDKIAEARVSYGGRGRLMEVQQPAYGQQLLDLIVPF